MSIHVTVSGNPIYLDRGKILLTDVELAKKNEWNRRRKIRIQQARQQAKDLAQTVRRRVTSDEACASQIEKEKKINAQNKLIREEIDSLQQEYEQCMSSVGAGHNLASMQNECEALEREKQELRAEIARARGAIAEEKLRAEKCLQREKLFAFVGKKQFARRMEDLRSRLVSHRPPVKSSCSGPKKTTVKVDVHQTDIRQEKPGTKYQSGSGKPLNPINTEPYSSSGARSNEIERHRKKPTFSDCEDLSDESDNSDVTWPPRTSRVVKEPIPHTRVRFYDHNTRVSKECPKPPYNVKHVDPSEQPNMSEAIAEEEEAYVRKENLDILARRENMIRGSRALRKERDKKEAARIIKEIEELEKHRKIQQAVSGSYPSECHRVNDFRRIHHERVFEELNDDIECGQTSTEEKDILPQNTNKPLPTKPTTESRDISFQRVYHPEHFEAYADEVDSEEMLDDLINKLREERARKQENIEKRFGRHDFDGIPSWVPQEEISERPKIDHPESHCSRGQQSQGDRMLRRSLDGYLRRKLSPDRKLLNQGVKQRRSLDGNLESKSPPGGAIANETSPRSRECSTKDKLSPIKQRLHDLKKCNCSEKCNCYPGEMVSPKDNEIASYMEGSPPKYTERKNLYKELVNNEDTLGSDVMGVENRSREPSPDVLRTSTQVSRIRSEETTCSSTDSTSQADTVQSSLTYEGVKVVVKVCERSSKKKKGKSPTKTCKDKDVQTSLQDSSIKSSNWNSQLINEIHTGSTSYMSPPSKLSPEQESLLCSILTKLDSENKNPKLQTYIKKLLTMTQDSIANLPVSSVSDISITSSVFEPIPVNQRKEQSIKQDVSCQADSSLDSSCNEEVLKFSELAKHYADRLQDLAGMLGELRLMPAPKRTIEDDTSYLNPPEEFCQSFKISESVHPGVYPAPLDASEFPTSIRPHPDFIQRPSPSNCNGFQSEFGDNKRCRDLSTIKECESAIEKSQVVTPKMFDPDLSSIKGTPQKRGTVGSLNDSAASSSLGILNDKDLSYFQGSSSDDFEDIFQNLGIAWALPTVRKARESRKLSGSSSSNDRAQCSHSTPLGPSPVKHYHSNEASTSGKHNTSSVKSQRLTDTKKLTPPSYSLNVPFLSKSPGSRKSS